jgi:transient receptor potential cation channel subfamily M protein 5
MIVYKCLQSGVGVVCSERELPAGLDQRLMTWETVQKENYLAKLERQHLESSEERLKSTSSK